MPENINMAEIARQNNISYQQLRKKIKSGMSPDDAVADCIADRCRSGSGKRPLNFSGKNYPTFAAACHDFDLNPATAYAQRSRLMREKQLTTEQASLRVLELAQQSPPKHRRREPIVIDGIKYKSQVEAAKALGLSIGSISARRVRDHSSFAEAVMALRQKKELKIDAAAMRLTVDPTSYWRDLSVAVSIAIDDSELLDSSVFLPLQYGDIFWGVAYLEQVMSDLATIRTTSLAYLQYTDEDINRLNRSSAGVKFVRIDDGIIMISDVYLTGQRDMDVALVRRAIERCIRALSELQSK